MSYCFVIQPFDRANTKRFEDVFEPAIRAAGLDEAYRVDRDPTTTVLIDKIEERIRRCPTRDPARSGFSRSSSNSRTSRASPLTRDKLLSRQAPKTDA